MKHVTLVHIAIGVNTIFGANFDRKDKTSKPTKSGKDWILVKLKSLLDCTFEVVDHKAAIRPTVKDRRPLLGSHPKQKNLLGEKVWNSSN